MTHKTIPAKDKVLISTKSLSALVSAPNDLTVGQRENLDKLEIVQRKTTAERPTDFDTAILLDPPNDINVVYTHWGPEGQRMETTLVVSEVIEEEIE